MESSDTLNPPPGSIQAHQFRRIFVLHLSYGPKSSAWHYNHPLVQKKGAPIEADYLSTDIFSAITM